MNGLRIPLTRTIRRLIAGVLVAGLLGGLTPAARAADGSLVIAALQVLEQEYVDPVHPIPLLNAAIAALRDATHVNAATLPDIPAGETEAEADAAFLAEFGRAAQEGVVPETPLAYAATRGMLRALHDSHTAFLEPAQAQEHRQQIMGRPGFTGIGVTIAERADSAGTHWIFVEDVLPGSPAEAAGVRRFDRIVQVGTTSLRNATAQQATQVIRGPAGSTAALTIQRGSDSVEISVVREPIRTTPVEVRLIQPGVAYARLLEFNRGAARELASALGELETQSPLRSIVLDLRSNPGGLISEASRIGGLFLPPGRALAKITGRGNGLRLLRSAGPAPFAQPALVVLVDGGSASASEIITGAFKDYHRAIIVGEKTAGALGGAVDAALPEGELSVTVERITTPFGETVEGVGIAPDTPVALTVADMERGDDVQLHAALRLLGVVESFRQTVRT